MYTKRLYFQIEHSLSDNYRHHYLLGIYLDLPIRRYYIECDFSYLDRVPV